jgi:hypothetical protein
VAFPAYAAVALAGLGKLPDTILTRSVVIRMRRRAPHEHVEPYRARLHEPEGKKRGQLLGDWAKAAAECMAGSWPDMPPGVSDRPADVWEPLLSVADAAGGCWPDRARAACAWLVRDNADRGISLGIRLLADLRDIFDGARALTTEDILAQLHALDAALWADLKGQPLDARGLARLLDPYDITPAKVKVAGQALQGYRAEHLADAWTRYLPPPDPAEAEPAEPPGTRTTAIARRFCRFRNPRHPAEPRIPPLTSQGSAGSGGSGPTARRPSERPGAQPPTNPPGTDPQKENCRNGNVTNRRGATHR